MKCRICGFELSDDRTYCPMCGTKVQEAPKASTPSNTGIAWNTKDFPKPKKLEDISINWGKDFDAFMAKDASEGFVSVQQAASKTPATAEENVMPVEDDVKIAGRHSKETISEPKEISHEPKETSEEYTQKESVEEPKKDSKENESRENAFELPKQMKIEQSTMENPFAQKKEEAKMPLWYTQNFTATGVMKTGPAYPINESVPLPRPTAAPMPAPSAEQAAAALAASMPDATIQYLKVDDPKPVYEAEEAQVKAEPKFNTFVAKNAEFQALLDQEYSRIHAARKEEASSPAFTTANRFARADRVKAQNITDFEKTIFGEGTKPVSDFSFDNLTSAKTEDEAYAKLTSDDEPSPRPIKPVAPIKPEHAYSFEDIKPAVKPSPASSRMERKPERAYNVENAPAKAFSYESDESDLNLDDLIADPLDPKFNIHTIELTIQKLELEAKQDAIDIKNKQSRLEAMKAAREAYFKFLDEAASGKPAADVAPAAQPDYQPVNPPTEKEEPVRKENFETVVRPAYKEDFEPLVQPAYNQPSEVVREPDAPRKAEFDANVIADEFEPTLQNRYTENTIQLSDFDSIQFEKEVADATKLPAELIDLYSEDDEDEEEEKPKRSHGILRFLLVLVVIVALAEGVILGLQKFLPDAKITAQAVEMQEAVVDAFSSIFGGDTEEE